MTTKQPMMSAEEFRTLIRQMLRDWVNATPEQRAEALRLAALAAAQADAAGLAVR